VTTLRTLRPTDRSSTAGRNKICFSPPTVQRGSGVQRVFSSIANGAFSLGLMRTGREAHHSPASTAEQKNEWELHFYDPICFHNVHRDNFTFVFSLKEQLLPPPLSPPTPPLIKTPHIRRHHFAYRGTRFCPETSIMLITGKYLTLLCLSYALFQKKMPKATVGISVSVCLSVNPHATTCLPPGEFYEILR